MADSNPLRGHRTWEDWLGIALGLVIALAPWIVDEAGSFAVVANAAIAGLAVMLLAELDLVSPRPWAVISEVAVGIWVVLSPLILGYGSTGSLRGWHVVAGVLVVLLAAFEAWQSRRS